MEEEPKNQSLYIIQPEKFSQSKMALNEDKLSVDESDDSDVQCGLGPMQCSRRLASPKLFLLFLSLASMAQGAFWTYFVGCLSTLEKRFSYDSKRSGLLMIADEIAPILLGMLFGYFGGKSHRPRWLGVGLGLGTVASLLMASPYFIYGRINEETLRPHHLSSLSKYNDSKTEFCDYDSNSSSENCPESIVTTVFSIFFLANFVKGISSLVFHAFGTPYMDDNVKKKDSPVYLATLFSLRLLGPTSGFLLSSLCLNFYEDPFYDPGYGPKDPRWVGAWWLGFVILGVLICIFSIPMLFFPKRFPGTKVVQKKETKKPKSPIEQFKDMGKAIKRLSKNPIIISHYLGTVLRLNGLLGYYVLMPKYMEMQFRQSASKASLYSGPISLAGMIIGILGGGLLIKRFKPRPRVMTGGLVVAESFSFIALIICMFITCPSFNLSGVSTEPSPHFNLETNCNADCLCSTKTYTPVCGPDGKSTYFSPCFAGCTGYNKTNQKVTFTDCKCVTNDLGEAITGDVTKGYCDSDCNLMIVFIAVLSVGKLLSSTSRVGNALVTLRSVDPEDKSLALGTFSGIASLLAFIPYPLIYGSLTDASCLIWEKSCGRTGNCWVYDGQKFRYYLHGVSAFFVACGCITDIIVCVLSPRLRNLYSEDEEIDEVDIKAIGTLDGHKGSISSLNGQEKNSTTSF